MSRWIWSRSSGSMSIEPGRRMPSFRRRKVSSSSHGSPMRPRKTDDGNCSANSLVKWHSPRSTNWSMKWLTRSVTSPSIASICFGAKIGSRILRYFRWRGGSTLSGMSGRTLPSSRKPSDENTPLFLNVASTAARLVIMNMPGMASTTSASTSCW